MPLDWRALMLFGLVGCRGWHEDFGEPIEPADTALPEDTDGPWLVDPEFDLIGRWLAADLLPEQLPLEGRLWCEGWTPDHPDLEGATLTWVGTDEPATCWIGGVTYLSCYQYVTFHEDGTVDHDFTFPVEDDCEGSGRKYVRGERLYGAWAYEGFLQYLDSGNERPLYQYDVAGWTWLVSEPNPYSGQDSGLTVGVLEANLGIALYPRIP